MKQFITDTTGLRAVRIDDISAAMINTAYFDQNNDKKVAINFILKSGEKATLFFNNQDQAKLIIDDL